MINDFLLLSCEWLKKICDDFWTWIRKRSEIFKCVRNTIRPKMDKLLMSNGHHEIAFKLLYFRFRIHNSQFFSLNEEKKVIEAFFVLRNALSSLRNVVFDGYTFFFWVFFFVILPVLMFGRLMRCVKGDYGGIICTWWFF